MTQQGDNPGWRGRLAWAALGVSVLVIAWFGLAAIGSRLRWWDPLYGFGTLALDWGSKLAMGALAFGTLALLIGLMKAPRAKPLILAFGALMLAGAVFGRLYAMRTLALGLPPLHDIQTDWSDPLMPSPTLLAARQADEARNPVEADPVIAQAAEGRWPGMAGKSVAQVQEASEYDPTLSYPPGVAEPPYPPLRPLVLARRTEDVYRAGLALMEESGWEIVSAIAPVEGVDGVIEATVTSGWFGFRDDVIVRLRPLPDGETRVDMRSVSRVGLSDLGVNALRVAQFLDRLRQSVA